jgi:hypothetical protein
VRTVSPVVVARLGGRAAAPAPSAAAARCLRGNPLALACLPPEACPLWLDLCEGGFFELVEPAWTLVAPESEQRDDGSGLHLEEESVLLPATPMSPCRGSGDTAGERFFQEGVAFLQSVGLPTLEPGSPQWRRLAAREQQRRLEECVRFVQGTAYLQVPDPRAA